MEVLGCLTPVLDASLHLSLVLFGLAWVWLEAPWAHLDSLGPVLELSWAGLGLSRATLGESPMTLRGVLGDSGWHLGGSWWLRVGLRWLLGSS